MVVVGTKRDFADGLGVAGERKGWYDCGFEFEHLCFMSQSKPDTPLPHMWRIIMVSES